MANRSDGEYNHCFRILGFLVQTCVEKCSILDCARLAALLPYCRLYLFTSVDGAYPFGNLRSDERD
jgi:hypothetical protein